MSAPGLVMPVQVVRLSRTRSAKEYSLGSVFRRKVGMRDGTKPRVREAAACVMVGEMCGVTVRASAFTPHSRREGG